MFNKENRQLFNIIIAAAAIVVIIIGLKFIKTFIPSDSTTGKSKSDSVSIALIGNVNMSKKLLTRYNDLGLSGFVSDSISSKIKSADIAVMNQCFTISAFTAPNNTVSDNYHIIKELGINMVSLANPYFKQNADYITQNTINELNSVEMNYAGAGEDLDSSCKASVLECNGRKIGLLSVYYDNPSSSKGNAVNATSHEKASQGIYVDNSSDNICYNIKRAKKTCDFLILSIAWGTGSSSSEPDNDQRKMARDFIDAGCDTVIGCSDFIQGIQIYKDKPIIYSIGNFLNSDYHANTEMIELNVSSKNKITLTVNGCSTEAYKTTALDGSANDQFINNLNNISYDVNIDSKGIVSKKEKNN